MSEPPLPSFHPPRVRFSDLVCRSYQIVFPSSPLGPSPSCLPSPLQSPPHFIFFPEGFSFLLSFTGEPLKKKRPSTLIEEECFKKRTISNPLNNFFATATQECRNRFCCFLKAFAPFLKKEKNNLGPAFFCFVFSPWVERRSSFFWSHKNL